MPSETIHFPNARHLSQLYLNDGRYLEKVELSLNVSIVCRDNWLQIDGSSERIADAKAVFELLESARGQGLLIRSSDFNYTLRCVAKGKTDELREIYSNPLIIKLKRQSVVPKTLNQKRYLQAIEASPITFGIGPAGTGKTHLAVAMALKELLEGRVGRIILTRPAVEAGETLGFLPGELQEKILPYLTPLYDSMNDIIGKEQTEQLITRGIIEIAPLAYMRGRTLANAFVVLDEAQNTTHEQMMMFLTRLGDDSRMVVTGDITQIDLPSNKQSGLKKATNILKDLEGICLFYFQGQDVVRHPLVQDIIDAYSRTDDKK